MRGGVEGGGRTVRGGIFLITKGGALGEGIGGRVGRGKDRFFFFKKEGDPFSKTGRVSPYSQQGRGEEEGWKGGVAGKAAKNPYFFQPFALPFLLRNALGQIGRFGRLPHYSPLLAFFSYSLSCQE